MKKNIKIPAIIASILFFIPIINNCDLASPFYFISTTPVEERASSIKILTGNDIPEIGTNSKYSFLIITDTHFGEERVDRHEDEFLKKFEELLSAADETLIPRFIVNLGDTLNAGQKGGANNFNKVAENWTKTAKEKLGISDYKIYSIIGNHDLYNDGWDVWKKNIWPYTSYYKFSVKTASSSQGFSFYFLDSGNGVLGAPQFENLKKNLEKDSSPKIILCHYPIYAGGQFYFTFNDTMERNKLISIYAKNNVKKVFEGHFHPSNDTYNFKEFVEVVNASYVYKRSVTLVTVDETAETVEHKFISF